MNLSEVAEVAEVAEAAIKAEFIARAKASLQAEIDLELAAYNAYVAEHGSFADAVREHYAALEADEAV